MASMAEKSDVAKREERILAFWQEHQVFEKTLEKEAPTGEYVFYDGPPFATGLPHYGHLLAGTLKDAIPRYQTMRGKHVARRWGWDCHGLPLENIVEKELGFKTKKDIEDYGIEKFNEYAKTAVLRYADDWKQIIPRLGRWADMEHDYRTMDASYSETVWWVFKTLHDRGLIYEGYKAMHICPRCETTLANFEVNLGYKDVTDIAVFVKFALVGEANTFLLAWTTTPWTLPGNVALAVNPDLDYNYVSVAGAAERYIVAASRTETVFKEKYRIQKTVKGSELIGQAYKPLFDDYARDESLKDRERGWKVYGADFVGAEEGTGIVHIAPAFGEDDLQLGQTEHLPFIQHVAMNGVIKPEVSAFAGLEAKPKGDPKATDKVIVAGLEAAGKIFAVETVTHSYPHCWRCETPLLNYAASSWFVSVSTFRDQLLANNQKIRWVPGHIKDGRFGRWLEGARDWAISRARYWGAPLPVWKCAECGVVRSFGSVAELAAATPTSGNRYYALRHGEADHIVANVVSCRVENDHHLTATGRSQVEAAALDLKSENIDLIITSDFIRTKETAAIVADVLGLGADAVVVDSRLREGDFGALDGHPVADYEAFIRQMSNRYTEAMGNGESLVAVKRRIGEFLYDIEKNYRNRNILIVSHETPLRLLEGVAQGLDTKAAWLLRAAPTAFRLAPSEHFKFSFTPLPHNGDYELDLHRPYIDEYPVRCACGRSLVRVPEVFDCWFESGAMPYGQAHYPFNAASGFDPAAGAGWPADFIAEGLDQTRGWFYSLLVLGTALFGESPYRSVIVNGLILAENGQKMSKRLKNYPDPLEVADRYGADALRLYLLGSPVVAAEELRFSERSVADVYRKIIARFDNCVAFYLLYPAGATDAPLESTNLLDRWILARFGEAAAEVTSALDRLEIDRAVRPLADFIDDLSTWYVRRSRDRFKAESLDQSAAAQTLRRVLIDTAKLLAPFAPFVAEDAYQKVGGPLLSVHLESWPDPMPAGVDAKLLDDMRVVRALISAALEARATAGMKVRQPLAALTIPTGALADHPDFLELIRDEVNVKTVTTADIPAGSVELDTTLTDELRTEGLVRDLVRAIQDLRKARHFHPTDMITVVLDAPESLRGALNHDFERAIRASQIEFRENQGEQIAIGDETIRVELS